MKNALLLFCLLAISTQIFAQAPPVLNDDEAIKKVIADESTAWAKHDTAAYFAAWADNDLTQGAWNNRNLSIGTYSGLEAIKKSVRDGIKANPTLFYQPNIERTDWLIKLLSPEWAWVNFTQKTKNVREQINTSYETRLMHKEGGAWKINVVNALWDYKNVVYPSPNPDEEDIKAVITAQRESFADGNLEAWSACFVHEPYLTWSVTNGGEPGDVLTARGWDALNDLMKKRFEKGTTETAKAMKQAKVTTNQWNIQIRSNVAYVTYNQHVDNEEKQTKMDSTETRVLEKISGKWKITLQATLVDFKDATPPIRTKY
jgi:hypothetical protein